jgi:hypothetical protein
MASIGTAGSGAVLLENNAETQHPFPPIPKIFCTSVRYVAIGKQTVEAAD